MIPTSLPVRWGLLTVLGLFLLSCTGPTAEDRALFHLFWVSPENLMARTKLPAGLGVAAHPSLVMTLIEAPERPAREATFRLVPTKSSQGSEGPVYLLARKDHGRFRGFQDRVVASIGPEARINVRLDIAYCADLTTSPGMGPPVAQVIDASDGTVMMTRPASSNARSLQPLLPSC